MCHLSHVDVDVDVDVHIPGPSREMLINRLLTVGHTVDEAAFLFASLDNSCHSQLMADAAAANGVPKKIIPHDVAQFTADAVQNPVSRLSLIYLVELV